MNDKYKNKETSCCYAGWLFKYAFTAFGRPFAGYRNLPVPGERAPAPRSFILTERKIIPAAVKIILTALKIVDAAQKITLAALEITPTGPEIADAAQKITLTELEITAAGPEIAEAAQKITFTTLEITAAALKTQSTMLEIGPAAFNIIPAASKTGLRAPKITSAAFAIAQMLLKTIYYNALLKHLRLIMKEAEMPITNFKKEDFILNSKTYLENAGLDSYIKEKILSIGYDENRLNEGLGVQETAGNSRENQLIAMHTAKSLHSRLEEIFTANRNSFIADSRLLKSAFIRDIPVKEMLGLKGNRKRSVTGYIEQARTFYHTLLVENEILDRLALFNFTPETIQTKLAGVDEVAKAYGVYKGAEKEAQDATSQCEKDFKKLQDWIRIFQDACRIVLVEKTQLLEKVGILVRSAKLKKKKGAEINGDNTGSSDIEQDEAA